MLSKRSICVNGRQTSVSIEEAFWTGAKKIAIARRTTLVDLVGAIDRQRTGGFILSSAIRVEVLNHFMSLAEGRAA
jgi:predicted DNA-binding ribbon-helix-helix protein